MNRIKVLVLAVLFATFAATVAMAGHDCCNRNFPCPSGQSCNAQCACVTPPPPPPTQHCNAACPQGYSQDGGNCNGQQGQACGTCSGTISCINSSSGTVNVNCSCQ
jgi:hypothetical protein